MRSDPIICVHVDFRVKMAHNDDNQTPNMAQDDDTSSDDSRTLTPPPPLPPTASPPPRFTVEEEQTRLYKRFNAPGTQLTVRLLPPPEERRIRTPCPIS